MEHTTQTLTTRDHVPISVDRYHEDGREAAILICPGFFQSKDTATFRRLSQALSAEHDVIAMDFRGHGRSGGRYTFSAREGADLDTVLAWAAARYRRLGILGFSMGGAIAINVASRHSALVRSLIAVSAPSAFEQVEFKFWTAEAIRTGLDGMEPGAGCRPGNLFLPKDRPLETVRLLRHLPILFIHGTRDVIVGVQHSHRLYAAAMEPKRLEIIDGGSHAEALFRDDAEAFLRLLCPWWAQTLPQVASPRHS